MKNIKASLFYTFLVFLLFNCQGSVSHETEIKPESIHEDGFQANFFAKKNTENKPAIIIVGGGQEGDYWAKECAKKGFVGLSLPYVNRENLPKLPEEIDLEYFEKAIKWLRKQKAIDPKKMIVMGASRNAELALVIASIFPELVSGVVAYAPSSVSWSNTVLPYNSDDIKASWKYKGNDIPYISMEKISGSDSGKLNTLAYWESGLAKTEEVEKASIQVENIKGPILLFSGIDDKVWPSAKMADMIETRLKKNNFKYDFQNIQYKNAGHLISGHPDINSGVRTGKMYIREKEYEFDFGGSNEGNKKAKQDARVKLFEFLEGLE